MEIQTKVKGQSGGRSAFFPRNQTMQKSKHNRRKHQQRLLKAVEKEKRERNGRKDNPKLIKYSKGMQNGRECGQFKKLKWVLQPRKQGHPNKRWGHTAVVHSGRLLIFGGNHNTLTREGVHTVDCESLEGDTLQFSVQPQMRESHSCSLYHDCLYIYGGCINQELTSDLIQVKLTGPTFSWRKLEQKNQIPPRESHVTTIIQKRFLLVYGGTTPSETFLDQFWILDLETVTWRQVKEINGRLQARIGATLTTIGQDIYTFGGEWGEGEESQYSNDVAKMRFQDEIKGDIIPCLNITKLQVLGVRPNPRTGHSCVDYKGRMLIIIGGEGVSLKGASLLYNDIWAFDLRTNTWSELQIQNRNALRPRANFTANIFKNTIYIFGGFVNINTFKCTDQLITLTLNQTRHHHKQQIDQKNSQLVSQNPQQPSYCIQCRFEYLPQERKPIVAQQAIVNPNSILASTKNIIHAARSITSPLQAMALVVDAVSKIIPLTHKTLSIELNQIKPMQQDEDLNNLLTKYHLIFQVNGLHLTKEQLQNIVISYRCQDSDPGFDLKNGLFRLGRQILFTQIFEDGMLHAYLLTEHGIHRSVLHLQTIVYQLQRQQNRPLFHFLSQHGIALGQMQPFELKMYIGSLTRQNDRTLQLTKIGNDFYCTVQEQQISFTSFVKDYFLNERILTLKVCGQPVQLIGFERFIKNSNIQRQQEPTTPFFSKVHIVIHEQPELINPPSAFIKLYALGRRVGIFNKYPFISGYLQISDLSVLNYPRTRCDSWNVRKALEQEIQALLEQSKKRQSQVPISHLEREIYL